LRQAAALLLLLTACISGGDVQAALDGYCGSSVTHSCVAQAECCDGFACAAGECRKVTPGTCLPVDAGTQATGQACGCNTDCASAMCSSSMCR
jgi:hypothetical protein